MKLDVGCKYNVKNNNEVFNLEIIRHHTNGYGYPSVEFEYKYESIGGQPAHHTGEARYSISDIESMVGRGAWVMELTYHPSVLEVNEEMFTL